ncbi:hypothetical protein N824_10645 [Pedobacter sp. V48]|nr:hypothetical protein N824_10645 [Pedobacter sp. V48]
MLMLSNFSWLEYAAFIGVSVLLYYAVILLVYYRNEMKGFLSSLAKGHQPDIIRVSDQGFVNADLLGKAAPEAGMSSLSMDELNFGGNDQLLQGELADCMQELSDTFYLALEKSWDKKKLFTSLSEIAECYSSVFASPLRAQVLAYISEQVGTKLGIGFSSNELEVALSSGVPGWGKALGAGIAVISFFTQMASAQDGNQGIAEATNKVAGYFDTGTDLMYAIGAIMGLVGAVKVYSKWNAGEPDTAKVATAWFGSCIFLVVVATVLKSFFGI